MYWGVTTNWEAIQRAFHDKHVPGHGRNSGKGGLILWHGVLLMLAVAAVRPAALRQIFPLAMLTPEEQALIQALFFEEKT